MAKWKMTDAMAKRIAAKIAELAPATIHYGAQIITATHAEAAAFGWLDLLAQEVRS